MHRAAALAALALLGAADASRLGGGLAGQELRLPPRAADAVGGARLARELRGLGLEAREDRVLREVAAGNVPTWLRALVPVTARRSAEGVEREVTLWVAPDYLAVGSDDDYFLVPLAPGTAQRVADLTGSTLPTPAIVDAIWRAAPVRLAPSPIPPSPGMTTVRVFETHHRRVRTQRARRTEPPGTLTAGHKKDVVLSNALAARPGSVAIYGWHHLDGRPIQPLYTGHGAAWVDYSHGVRLVHRSVRIDGVAMDVLDVLRDERLAALLSDEGPIAEPRYR